MNTSSGLIQEACKLGTADTLVALHNHYLQLARSTTNKHEEQAYLGLASDLRKARERFNAAHPKGKPDFEEPEGADLVAEARVRRAGHEAAMERERFYAAHETVQQAWRDSQTISELIYRI